MSSYPNEKTGRCAKPVSSCFESPLLSHPLERDHLASIPLRRVGRLWFRSGGGCFHKAADLLRRTSLHLVGDVGIGVQGEPGAVMAQHTGERLYIHTAGESHGGEGVPEIVEAHMLLDAGLCQQLAVDPGHRVRAPVAAGAGRWEQKGIVRVLLMLPHQELHRLPGQRHPADGVPGLGFSRHQLPVNACDLSAHRQDTVFSIQVVPPQGQQFAPPQSAGQLQVEHGQDAVLFRFPEIGPQLFRRQDGHLLFLLGRDAAVVAGVVGNKPLLHRLLECRGQHHVDAPDRTAGEGSVGLTFPPLYPSVGSGVIVELLNLNGGEPPELNPSQSRNDVVFDGIGVGLGGIGADHRLAVSFKPQPAPLRHRVILVVVDGDSPVVPDGPGQFFFALRLGPGGYTFLDRPSGHRVDALGIPTLPAPVGLFPDAALAVCTFFWHR